MSTDKKLSRAEVSKKFANLYAWPPQSVLEPGLGHVWDNVVVFDFHQVCTNWLEQYIKFINKTYGRNIDHTKIAGYNLQFDPTVNLSAHEHDEAFISFARLAKGGYGSLKAYPGIRDTFRKILATGTKIHIYTWTPGAAERIPDGDKSYGSGIAQRVTLDLIESMDLGIDVNRDVKFMSPGEKKYTMAKKHIPLIVEDNPETAVSVGMGAMHAVILVPEPSNEGLIAPNVLRLEDRNDLADTVINFYKKLDEAGILLKKG